MKNERNEKEGRDLFLKMRPPDFFRADPSLSLPQKGSIFMANWESSYGANLLQKVVKSSYYNSLYATFCSK